MARCCIIFERQFWYFEFGVDCNLFLLVKHDILLIRILFKIKHFKLICYLENIFARLDISNIDPLTIDIIFVNVNLMKAIVTCYIRIMVYISINTYHSRHLFLVHHSQHIYILLDCPLDNHYLPNKSLLCDLQQFDCLNDPIDQSVQTLPCCDNVYDKSAKSIRILV